MMTSAVESRDTAAPSARTVSVTAAICTHGRPETLRDALRSVAAQDPAPAEILVVDNAPPDDATERLVRDEFPRVVYRREPVAGLDVARNRALAEAAGDVIAFLDDDVVLEAGAIGGIASVFAESASIGACTGRVSARQLDTEGRRLFEANGGFERGEERIRLPRDAARPLHGFPAPRIAWALSVGAGSCLAVRRALAQRIGGFDEALDQGAVLPGGGDHDMLWRVLESGHEVVYEPAVRAQHLHRDSVDGAVAQIVGHQRALIALLTKTLRQSRPADRGPILAFLAWRLLKPGARLLKRAAGRDPLPARAILRMWGACWQGLTAYRKGVETAATRRREAAR